MKRESKSYSTLKALARQRDSECWGAYVRELARPLMGDHGSLEPPADDDESLVLHHVNHRAGLLSMDREDNVVTLTPEMHQRVHAPGKEIQRRQLVLNYLTSEEVEEWRALHGEEIREAEEVREEAALKRKKRRCCIR